MRLALQVARELELVAKVDLVDELHAEQEPEEHGRRQQERAVEIEVVRPLLRDAALDFFVAPVELRTAHRQEEAEQDHEEHDPARGREPAGEAVEDAVGRPEEPPDLAAARPDRLAGLFDEGLLGAPPLLRVEAGQVLPPDGGEGAPKELRPLLSRRHAGAIRSGDREGPG